ncbi:hypothetical protein NKR19_g4988 [Coniochaeta hoffmannii]|uniref:Uncharacterized protein n=1 Tax=Coniochaeta hoffmannii TaxID=91930 RepID=A0AA38RZ70_9PEZI|nr:hypothetical protein NKR19_g4988 [Coniochaeta hoffmannii]
MQRTVPYDGRDQADVAEEYYNDPVRSQNRELNAENLRLKCLLRTHGISWSPSVVLEPQSSPALARKTSTRSLRPRASLSSGSSGTDQKSKMPHLPMEVQLRILHFALTSNHPIIDPLSKLRPENITQPEKTIRANQLAMGFLATCKTFQTEGTRILWGNNTFTFTTHEALRNFANLDLQFRKGIKSVNLRVIATFSDDKIIKREFGLEHHPSLRKDMPLKVHLRPRENGLARKGFRVYAWTQLIDFLHALAPPHFAGCDKSKPRPRLLPNLDAMRIDFVNFFHEFLPSPDHVLHEAAAHDNGCTLNELMITGLPCTDTGLRGGYELAGMVRDNGLFMDATPTFVQLKTRMKPLSGHGMCTQVMRSWRALAEPSHEHPSHPGCYGRVAPAPNEPGAPASKHKRPTVWKRVPITRDSEEREWIEFDRNKGLTVEQMEEELGIDMDSDVDEDEDEEFDEEFPYFTTCVKCGEQHPVLG